MTCLNTALRARLQARLIIKEAQLTKLYATYDLAIQQQNESYRFDSGEATQQATKRKLKDLLDQIRALESQIDLLYNRLGCRGIVNINTRRKL